MDRIKTRVAAIGVMLTMAGIAQGAPIEVTGGTLSASASWQGPGDSHTTTVLADPDYFQVAASYEVANAAMSVNNAGGVLALNGRTFGDYYNFNLPISAYASASITFSLAAATEMKISWSSLYQDTEQYSGGGTPGRLILSNGATELFHCSTDKLSCGIGYFSAETSLSSITLGPGNYSMAANLSSLPRSGQVDNSFQFALTPTAVPLPMAGWLLLSGLGGLVGFTRRRKRSA